MGPSAPRHALGWLGEQAQFRSLTDRARRLLALQADLRACAPSLGLVAMDLEQETLVVGTPGAGAAAKLRQLEPTIVADLAGKGWQVKRIRFRPQPVGSAPPVRPFETRGDIPPAALEAISALAEQTSDERLKEALTNLVSARGRRARS